MGCQDRELMVAGPRGVATRVNVREARGLPSQHSFKSMRRAAAIREKNNALIELKLSAAHAEYQKDQLMKTLYARNEEIVRMQTEKRQVEAAHLHYQQQIMDLQGEVQSLRLLVELAPKGRATATSSDVSCQTATTAVDAGTSTEGEVEPMVPMSKVESLLDMSIEKAVASNEETTRTIVRELQQRHDMELDKVKGDLEAALEELTLLKEERLNKGAKQNFEEDGHEAEVCDWESSSDGSASTPELSAGMPVKLIGLTSCPELNGRPGVLVKYNFERDRWQVDLGIDLGLKLINGCNVRATGRCNDGDPPQDHTDVGNLHQNDIGLPCDGNGTVQWDRVMSPMELSAFLGLCSTGAFRCSVCGVDASSMSGTFGYVQCESSDGAWEERHLLNMTTDDSNALQCLRCYYAATPCKYYKSGWCFRGSACAYQHS